MEDTKLFTIKFTVGNNGITYEVIKHDNYEPTVLEILGALQAFIQQFYKEQTR